METSCKNFDWIRIRGAEFFPVISWSLEDEMTVFWEPHKLLFAVMKTLHLFRYFYICHENIFLHLDVWTQPRAENCWWKTVGYTLSCKELHKL